MVPPIVTKRHKLMVCYAIFFCLNSLESTVGTRQRVQQQQEKQPGTHPADGQERGGGGGGWDPHRETQFG